MGALNSPVSAALKQLTDVSGEEEWKVEAYHSSVSVIKKHIFSSSLGTWKTDI